MLFTGGKSASTGERSSGAELIYAAADRRFGCPAGLTSGSDSAAATLARTTHYTAHPGTKGCAAVCSNCQSYQNRIFGYDEPRTADAPDLRHRYGRNVAARHGDEARKRPSAPKATGIPQAD